MNTTFNFNHIGLLLKRFFIENRNRELTFWGILIIIFGLIHQGETVRTFIYVTGFIFAARQFKLFAYNPSGMHYLMIPATHVEKLTASFILTTIYYFGMILLTYAIGNIIGTEIFNLLFGLSNPISWELFNIDGNQSTASGLWEVFSYFALIQAIFVLGSLYFKRNAVVKTFLTMIALGFILAMIQILLMKINFGDFISGSKMISTNIIFNSSNISEGVKLGAEIGSYFLFVFLWLVSYFRLTEKQI